MINRIVSENIRRNSLQTLAKVFAISIEVTIILTWAGIQHGMGPHPDPVRLNIGIYASVLLLFAFAVSFIFVTVARYSEVLEMSQEVGILSVLGASTGYILNLLFQETLVVTLLGTIAGIVMTYGAQGFIVYAFSDCLTLDMVYKWWPMAGAISAAGPLSGEIFALRRSVRLGVIQALSAE